MSEVASGAKQVREPKLKIIGGSSLPGRIRIYSEDLFAEAKHKGCKEDACNFDVKAGYSRELKLFSKFEIPDLKRFPIPRLLVFALNLIMGMNPKELLTFVAIAGSLTYLLSRFASAFSLSVSERLLVDTGYIVCFLLFVKFKISKWHGAEHMAIVSYEKTGSVGAEIIWEQSPIHGKCGGRFFAPMFLGLWTLAFVPEYVFDIPRWSIFLVFLEVMLWADHLVGFDRIPGFSHISRLLQYYVTTACPDKCEVATALVALKLLTVVSDAPREGADSLRKYVEDYFEKESQEDIEINMPQRLS